MKLPRFGVEEWLNVHEKSAIYDIAGVSIKALTMEELFDLSGLDKDAIFWPNCSKKKDGLQAGLRGHQSSKLRWLVYTRTCRLIISSKPTGQRERRC